MLRVERNKPNILCILGHQFKPGITEISKAKDAEKLMESRQFNGAISNGDMTILSFDGHKIVKELAKPKSKQEMSISKKTIFRIIGDCESINDLENMLKGQKSKPIQKAIRDRIISLTPNDADEDSDDADEDSDDADEDAE